MPEAKLKNLNSSHSFNVQVKRIETKLDIIEKLQAGLDPSKRQSYEAIKRDIKKFQEEISTYEKEINFLTKKINEIENLEFLVQNSFQTSQWYLFIH